MEQLQVSILSCTFLDIQHYHVKRTANKSERRVCLETTVIIYIRLHTNDQQ